MNPFSDVSSESSDVPETEPMPSNLVPRRSSTSSTRLVPLQRKESFRRSSPRDGFSVASSRQRTFSGTHRPAAARMQRAVSTDAVSVRPNAFDASSDASDEDSEACEYSSAKSKKKKKAKGKEKPKHRRSKGDSDAPNDKGDERTNGRDADTTCILGQIEARMAALEKRQESTFHKVSDAKIDIRVLGSVLADVSRGGKFYMRRNFNHPQLCQEPRPPALATDQTYEPKPFRRTTWETLLDTLCCCCTPSPPPSYDRI